MRGLNRFLIAAMLFGVAAGALADDADATAIAAKTAELVPADAPPAQRIIAVHRFVRDEIRQIATQYG